MNIISVKHFCESYLDFHVEKPKSLGEGLFLGAKLLTFLTGIIPLIVGVTLGISDITLWYRNRNITAPQPGNQPKNVQIIQNLAANHIGTPAPDNRNEVENLNNELVNPNNAIVPYQEVPSAPSIPVVSREVLERIKDDALTYNNNHYYVSHFPQELHELILSFLSDPQDLKNFALVSTTLHRRVIRFMDTRMVQIKNNISQLIEYANLLDEEIIRITNGKSSLIGVTPPSNEGIYNDFKFDTEKWQKVIGGIKRFDLITKNEGLDRICYLDLVEALAEYNTNREEHLPPHGRINREFGNVDEHTSLGCRPISKIEIQNIVKGLGSEKTEVITQILDDAKSTLKGDLSLPFYSLKVSAGNIMLHALNQENNPNQEDNDDVKGLFMCAVLYNRESYAWNWHDPHYKRHLGGSMIHLDWLIGKQTGDRLLIPYGIEEEGDRQIILRCQQFYGISFERCIIEGVLRLETEDVDSVSQDVKNETLAKIKNAYGEELVAAVAKSINVSVHGVHQKFN